MCSLGRETRPQEHKAKLIYTAADVTRFELFLYAHTHRQACANPKAVLLLILNLHSSSLRHVNTTLR
jgi:hypothetical protein